MERELLQTPRQRIKSFNKQIEYWRCYGYTRICQQEICSFCQHCHITASYDGEVDIDCDVSAPRFLAGDEVYACKQFKAIKNWRYHIEKLLSDVLMDIIKDQCKTYTEKQQRDTSISTMSTGEGRME